MNLAWGVGYRNWAADDLHPDEKRVLPKEAESLLHPKISPEEFAQKLLGYDVVSFDIFDTLILRPFERPTDLFHMVGARLDYLDFARFRAETERKARQRKYKEEKTYEVTLEEIWEMMEEDVGIPKKEGMSAETEAELTYCFGNPYMLEVFRCLKARGNDAPMLIAVSDMYLPSEVLRKLLDKCGFSGMEKIYVSCEQGGTKSDGSLYGKVRRKLEREAGRRLIFIHTGDNRVSDVEKAREKKWDAQHYPNVNDLGEWYRARDLSAVTGSLYRGMVNAHIYNGLYTFNKAYELGYIYGGLFVTGYCQWIHRKVKEYGADKILFLARDGDVLCKAYRKMYPKEAGEDFAEYVYWSRKAATKMGAAYFKYDFFRRFVHHKINQGLTLKDIFRSMELDQMLEGCLDESNHAGRGPDRRGSILTESSKLTPETAEKIEKYLKLHWSEVLEQYRQQRDAAGNYYRKVLSGHKKAAAVDVGWAGSGAVVLQYLVKKEWELDCEIIGLLAGTNSANNGFEKDTAEGLRYIGKQESFLYSQELNRDIWKFHNAAKGHNLLWELLLSSREGSLKGFYPGKDVYEISLGKESRSEEIGEIQRGILDFVEDWMKLQETEKNFLNADRPVKEPHEISGADVYGVMKLWCDEANKQELEKWFDKEGI